MFLFDDFVMTTEQQTNLKFLVRLGKSPLEAFYMLEQVYKEQTCLIQQFLSGTKDAKKDVRLLKMIPGVEGLPPVEMKPIKRLCVNIVD